MRLRSRFLTWTSIVGPIALLLALGCKDDGVDKLFEEDGPWRLEQFNLEGGALGDIQDSRIGAFWLLFDDGKKVVAASTCVDSNMQRTPENSICNLDDQSVWECNCYAYEFERNFQRWLEFEAGDPRPDVIDDGGGVPTGTGGAGGGVLEIEVAQVAEVSGSYTWRPLPQDLFGSRIDEFSFFRFELKADSAYKSRQAEVQGPACDEECGIGVGG